jgi:uncharacterized membrane protein YccC
MTMTLKEYITSEDTESAFRFLVGAASPLLVATGLGYTELGIFMLLGSTFVFGIDIPIALPKKLGFMALSGLLSALIFLVFTQVKEFPVLNGILLLITLFILNFLSPFSPNFSIVALLLNLSVMIGLSMASTIPTLAEALPKAGYLLLGSAWYTLYALLLHPLQRPRQLRRRLQECLRLTADYFAGQATLFEPGVSRTDTLLALSRRQADVVEAHQQIREVLLREPMNITNPETFMGRATYFLANLVDLIELATASAWSLQAVPDHSEEEGAIPLLRTLNEYVVSQLRQLEVQIAHEDRTLADPVQDADAEGTLQQLTEYLNDMKARTPSGQESAEEYRQLRRLQRYFEQQLLLLRNMRDVLARRSVRLDLAADRIRQFAIRDTIGWDYLRSHLSFKSGFFRYALRMALTAVVAYYLAVGLGFEYPSWALLTVLVILKPGFSLSKERLAHRVYGTVVGVLVGLGLFYVFHPGSVASMAIFLGSQFFAFSFVKRQYAVTSCFFTLFVLFFYSYLHREFMDAAFYRLLDTVLAAGLCWLSIRFVFPYWEVQNLPTVVKESLRADRALLKNVLDQVDAEALAITNYKLARKEAFLKMDDLLNSYRLAQIESPGQTEVLTTIQRISLLIYTQLSLLLSLGSFLKRCPDYRWGDARVKGYLQEALRGVDSLIGNEGRAETGQNEREQNAYGELATRRREIDQLLLENSPHYLSKVHDLFWVESAFELMEITHKLRRMMQPAPEALPTK